MTKLLQCYDIDHENVQYRLTVNIVILLIQNPDSSHNVFNIGFIDLLLLFKNQTNFMGDNNKKAAKSRRWFLSLLSPGDKKETNPEMVKMLTADGKVIEIKKSVLAAVTKNKKSSNKEIYDWMQNPSKDKNC